MREVTSATAFLSSVHFSSSFWISSIPEVAAFSTASDMELSALLLASIVRFHNAKTKNGIKIIRIHNHVIILLHQKINQLREYHRNCSKAFHHK
jgi:hypothetical protein